ncbi:MAG: ATP-binding protein, partial [Lachnospiraceae bacterium]|nr:ATP-binding protein [Lachnospiraceae bacterium]
MEQAGKTLEEFMADAYFGAEESGPFTNRAQEWEAWQSFLDMLCLTALTLREEGAASRRLVGSLLGDRELMEALEAPGPQKEEKEDFAGRYRYYEIFQTLLSRERGTGLPFTRFFEDGMLSDLEILTFLMAAAVDLNRRYERAFGVLKEEEKAAARPTRGLALDLAMLLFSEEEEDFSVLWDEDSFLNRFLMEPVPDTPELSRLSRPLILHRRVIQTLAGQPNQLGGLSACGRMIDFEPEMDQILAHGRQFEELIRVFSSLTGAQKQGVIQLRGADGMGKRFLRKCLASVAELDILCLDMKKILAQEERTIPEILREAVIKCICEKNLLYLEHVPFGQESLTALQRCLLLLQDKMSILFVGSTEQKPGELAVSGDWYCISLEAVGTTAQKSFWQYFAQKEHVVLDRGLNLDQLVSRFDMSPGRIQSVLSCAALDAEIGEEGFFVSQELLERQIRAKCSAEFGDYATRLQSPFVWEDLEVSEESRQLLEEVCDRVRFRSVVNEDFGFGKKLPYGSGTSVVLYGPPGTGKTMAAQVLANELGLDIYRIDLSQIGSKYIGETEKNLGAVFDSARGSNAILFFDEADALFTKRTDVSSSNDRYANAET